MKRKYGLSAVLILCVILFITSCNTAHIKPEKPTSSNMNTESFDSSHDDLENGTTDVEATTKATYDESSDIETEMIDIDLPSINLENIDDYNNYIANNKQPEGFVTYEMLSDIGTFRDFVIPVAGYPTYYGYNLIDPHGFVIQIFITHIDDSEKDNVISTEAIELERKPESGFLTNSQKEYQKVSYNGIEYRYTSNGKLRYIITYVDGKKIAVSPGSVFNEESHEFVQFDFINYNASQNNLITQLLSGNENKVDLAKYFTEDKEK